MRRVHAGVAMFAVVLSIAAWGQVAAQNSPKPGPPAYEPAPFALPSIAPSAYGARSLGMGRAFVALADDPTASLVNPAGLAFLKRPQLSLHGRLGSDERDSLLVGGAWAAASADEMRAVASADPSFALPAPLPPLSVDPRATYEGDTFRPAFAAGVLPLERVTLSFFLEQSRQLEGGGRLDLFEPFFTDRFRSSTQLELSLWGAGVAAAKTVGDRIHIGAALRGARYELAAFDSYRVDDWSDFEFNSAPPSFDHLDLYQTDTLVDDSDTLIALTLGVVFEPRDDLSLGAVYRQGGDVSFATRSETLRCTDIPGQGNCVPSDPSSGTVTSESGQVGSSIPDSFALGVAWWIDDPLVVAMDVTFESYDDAVPTVASAIGSRFAARLDSASSQTRVHLGAEYEVGAGRRSAPIYLRGGLFTDPDRDGSQTLSTDRLFVTLGAGIALHRWQLDGAVQLGDGVGQVLVSLDHSFR